MPLYLVTITLATISLIILFRRLYIAFCGPLRDVPGPAWAKFTRLWEVYALIPGDLEKKLVRLHRRYGMHLKYKLGYDFFYVWLIVQGQLFVLGQTSAASMTPPR